MKNKVVIIRQWVEKIINEEVIALVDDDGEIIEAEVLLSEEIETIEQGEKSRIDIDDEIAKYDNYPEYQKTLREKKEELLNQQKL